MSRMRPDRLPSTFRHRSTRIYLLVTVVGLVGVTVIGACGGSPSPEYMASPESLPSPKAVADTALARGANAAPTEQRVGLASPETLPGLKGNGAERSFEKEAALRTYLADRFLFKAWYPKVREVVIRGDVSAVFTTLSAPNEKRRKVASQICAAVLTSNLVGEAHVTAGPGPSVACP